VYVKAWRGASRDNLDPDASNHALWSTDTKHNVRSIIIKLRWGLFYNKKLAYRYGSEYLGAPARDDICPLPGCGMQDGCGHILSGCRNAGMQAAYILRHDQAVKMIVKALSKGSKGNCLTIMDAGTTEENPDYANGKRLKPWMLPDLAEGIAIDRMRPDSVRIATLRPTDTPPLTQEDRANHVVDLIEVGYAGDTMLADKAVEKRKQHMERNPKRPQIPCLRELLEAAGWQVHMHVFALGTAGGVTRDLRKTLESLGLSAAQSKTTANALSRHSIATAHSIAIQRRCMEQVDQSHGSGPTSLRSGVH
jgi:hypothetical protein